MTMPSSARSSSNTRNSATESIPPETATPTRSPARSNSCRRMWVSTRCARECMYRFQWAKISLLHVIDLMIRICALYDYGAHSDVQPHRLWREIGPSKLPSLRIVSKIEEGPESYRPVFLVYSPFSRQP